MKFGFKKQALAFACLLSLVSSSSYAAPVDLDNVPVADAIRMIGTAFGRNVSVNGSLTGKVSLHIEDADFDTVLDVVAATHNLGYIVRNNVVIVSDSKTLNTTDFFKLRHISPETFKKLVENSMPNDDDIIADVDNNRIGVRGTPNDLNRIQQLIDKFDVAQKQVNIQATVIELTKGKNRDIGWNLGVTTPHFGGVFGPGSSSFQSVRHPDGTPAFGTDVSGLGNNAITGNGFIISGALNHEEALNGGKVLARPNITTFDGKLAKISMGDEVPVFTSTGSGSDSNATVNVEYKDVGVNLEVTPRINDDDKGTVTLVIKPTVSTITEWVSSGNNKAPQISSRTVETVVRVKSGETILIGGLLKHDELKSMSGIPLLHKIPILGHLFKSSSLRKSDTELVIAITPQIIYDEDGVPQVRMQKVSPRLHDELMEAEKKEMRNNLPAAEYEKSVEAEKEKAAEVKLYDVEGSAEDDKAVDAEAAESDVKAEKSVSVVRHPILEAARERNRKQRFLEELKKQEEKRYAEQVKAVAKAKAKADAERKENAPKPKKVVVYYSEK